MIKILIIVGQNIAELYYNHIRLTMLCIFLSEYGLKSSNLLLQVTENELFLKYCQPP